jgi:hypothetical protein
MLMSSCTALQNAVMASTNRCAASVEPFTFEMFPSSSHCAGTSKASANRRSSLNVGNVSLPS